MRGALQAAYGYLLGQVGDALEVMPGEEFRVAVHEASKVYLMLTCLARLHKLSSACELHGCVAQRYTVMGCVCCNLISVECSHATGIPNLQVDAKMMFGDRLLHITLARVWAALSTWEKMKLVWTLVHTGVSMPDKDELKEELESMKVLYC